MFGRVVGIFKPIFHHQREPKGLFGEYVCEAIKTRLLMDHVIIINQESLMAKKLEFNINVQRCFGLLSQLFSKIAFFAEQSCESIYAKKPNRYRD